MRPSGRSGLDYNQRSHQIWISGSDQKRRMTTKRLADKVNRSKIKLVQPEHNISDVRASRHIGRCPLALTLTSRIERDPAMRLDKPRNRLLPLASISRHPM